VSLIPEEDLMGLRTSLAGACLVIGLLATSGAIAYGQEKEDDKSAPERWEKVTGTDGKASIRTKETVYGRKITIQAEKETFTRYVSLGFRWPNASRPDYLAIQQKPLRVSDRPLEYRIPGDGLYEGLIQIGTDPAKPETPNIKGFKGYDKLTFDDGAVFIVKIAK
jgi:hypothetical protein